MEVVRCLSDFGADEDASDKDDWTPIHFASKDRNVDVVRCLLEADAGRVCEGDGCTPIRGALSFDGEWLARWRTLTVCLLLFGFNATSLPVMVPNYPILSAEDFHGRL